MQRKICFVSPYIPPDFAGAGKRTLNQAKYLAQKGYRVSVITHTNRAHADNVEIISIETPDFAARRERLFGLKKILYYPVLFLRLFREIRCRDFDIVHCIPGGSLFSLLCILSAKISGKKVIAETTLVGSDDPVSIQKSRCGILKYKIFNLSDVIVNISPLLLDRCEKTNIRGAIHIIANSVDTSKFTNIPFDKKHRLRDKLGLNKSCFLLLYVGVIRDRKGVKELVEIFNMVNNHIENLCLVLAGPTNKDTENSRCTTEVREMISRLDLKSKILLTGEIANVEEWMMVSDVFVFASKQEGFGTVLIEAMSAGLPVVTSSIPQITEYIIRNGHDGIIAKNKTDFASAIKKLYFDKNFYNNISHNARETAKNRFSNDIIMAAYIELYANMLKD